MADEILRVEGLGKHFGGLVAVDVERMVVGRGSITALIGPNGAGKTTLFNQLTGFDRPDRGTITFDGTDVSGWSPSRIARRGIVRTFQLTKVFGRMSVLDNLKLAAPRQDGERMLVGPIARRWRGQERAIQRRADELLEQFRLVRVRDEFAGTLSGGQRKLLEMARALMAEPKLVLLDEPMAGVNPSLVEEILSHVRSLRDAGLTVLFVEHDMDVVMGISDTVICMAQGRVISVGSPRQVVGDPEVRSAYLGLDAGVAQ